MYNGPIHNIRRSKIKKKYKYLYSSKTVNIDCHESSSFFVNPTIPKLSDDLKKICEGKVTNEEATEALKTFKENKVPGNDGLPFEFYKTFWHLLGESLRNSINVAFESGILSTSQRQAIITLIDTKDKDCSILDNWRPISL